MMAKQNVLFSLISAAHFYVSLFWGFIIFEGVVQPYYKIDVAHASSMSSLVSAYALNVLAFGTLVYVATRPLILLTEHMLSRLFRTLEKDNNN